jgi:phosphoribosyl 1,2-cyclic phosphate phosphodiesterase
MADLRITFLGSGTSLGVPVIGCQCAVCSSPDPRDKRTRASLHVQTPECSWVIDTGADFRSQLLREGITKVDAVVYTHSHTDHIMGFDDLRVFCFSQRNLPIYASSATMADLRRAFEFAFNGQNRFPGYIHPEPRVIEGTFVLGKTEVTPLPVPHGRESVNGYLLSRDGRRLLAYLSDCKCVPDEIIDQIRGVEVLVIDALRHTPHPTHLTVAQAIEVVQQSAAHRALFTHLSHELGHKQTEASLPANIRLAYDGLRLEL